MGASSVRRASEHAEILSGAEYLYKSQPTLYEMDYDPEGFEWINSIAANENLLIFCKKDKEKGRDPSCHLQLCTGDQRKISGGRALCWKIQRNFQ